jgi:hypothetical protein
MRLKHSEQARKAMRILRSEKQKDTLAKFFWDMAKVAFAVQVLTPLAKPEALRFYSLAVGFVAGLTLALVGYLFDGVEVKP